MKVISKTTDDSETSVELDLFEGRKLTKAVKKRIQEDVGNYLVEQTLKLTAQGKTPVQGVGDFPALSPAYKKKKKEEVGNTKANLEFEGQLKDEIDFVPSPVGISIGVYGERALAADGHNNLSGESSLPLRRFLPDEGQTYKAPIKKEVERIIADAIGSEITFRKSMFKGITTKKELYAKLENIFGSATRAELSLAVYRNEELTNILEELKLLEVL